MKQISKQDLNYIFSAAKNNFIDLDKSDFDSQQFVALAYLKAVAGLLNVEIEVAPRKFVEPVEE